MSEYPKDVLETARDVMIEHIDFHLRAKIRYGGADKSTTMSMLCYAISAERKKLTALADVVEELLDYSGGAETALHDEYVMDRLRSAMERAKS